MKLKLQKGSVLRHFFKVNDFRQEYKVKHNLIEIIVMTICAVISGADDWVEVEMYCKARKDWLKTILELPNGIPSHDTFQRIFRLIDPEQFRKCFLTWAREVARLSNGEVVAIDGKTLRGSKDGDIRSPIHMVSAWANTNSMVLGQVKTDEKSNEITAIPRLLEVLQIKGCIITIDAMGCQKDIAEKIIEKEADYLLALKGNQGNFYEEVKLFFDDCMQNNFKEYNIDFYTERNKDHGRYEIRKCFVTSEIQWLSEKKNWKNLKSIAMVESTRIIKEKTTVEYRFYITSLAADAKQIGKSIRAHWGIENSLHWCLDVTFKEDSLRLRKDNGPENMAVIRHVALNLMKNDPSLAKLSMKKRKKYAEWSHDYMVKLVFGNLNEG